MNNLTKKILLLLSVMAIVAVIGWFGRKAYRGTAERRLIAQASEYAQKKDFQNAALCLQRALQMNPQSAGACTMMADMLESAAAPAALSWRIRAAQIETNNSECRFAWARTALTLHDPHSAVFALSGLDEKAKSSSTYHKLMGALAWESGHGLEAEQQYLEALRIEPTNQTIFLNLATIRLASTNPVTAQTARLSLEQIPAASPLRLTALSYLAADAEVHGAVDQALKYSTQIVNNPQAACGDKIRHLQLLGEAKSTEYVPMLAALESEAQKTSEYAVALGRWKLATAGPTNALHWLQKLPSAIQTNQPVPLVITDCQIGAKDWNGLLAVVEKQDWSEAESYRLALESLAQRSLGQAVAAQTSWRKALRQCDGRLDRLARLAQVTGLWGWNLEKTETLREITKEFPKEKWAVDLLIAELYRGGNTIALGEVLSKVCEMDPADVRFKNCLATVCLLRKTELEKAHRLASEAYNSSTNNPFFISTYAYSLFTQNRQAEALKVLKGVHSDDLQIPSVAAYYGVIEAESGHKDIAKGPLQRAEAAALLPEEKELVRMAIARL